MSGRQMKTSNRLYIIGNGFDLYHGIKSSYWHFRDFVKKVDNTLFDALEEYFNPDDLWSDFEKALEFLDTDKIVDEAGNYLESYSNENWKDAYHHDYQYEIQTRIDIVTDLLKKIFTEWILQLELPEDSTINRLSINKNSAFLNFNYTRTLEKLYGVSLDNIIYIHNKIENKESNLILGHSREPNSNNSFNKNNSEEQDVRITEGNSILDQYFLATYKSTKTVIHEYANFFNSLSSIEEIIVLGHSLSDVDLPYFEKIIQKVDKEKVLWSISYHSEQDAKHHHKVLMDLGIDDKLITIGKINSFNYYTSTQLEIPFIN